jgi:hypothetical protein
MHQMQERLQRVQQQMRQQQVQRQRVQQRVRELLLFFRKQPGQQQR